MNKEDMPDSNTDEKVDNPWDKPDMTKKEIEKERIEKLTLLFADKDKMHDLISDNAGMIRSSLEWLFKNIQKKDSDTAQLSQVFGDYIYDQIIQEMEEGL